LEERLDRAHRKIEGDEELLQRARRAMTIGLGLLEDQKNNALENEKNGG
jgi:hypothetical protein